MQTSWRHLLKDLELVNGLSLDQVLRKSGILPKIVHKELGTMLRKRCYWNLQKVDILVSVQRLHCPGGKLKSKGKGKVSIHFSADQDTVDTIYRIILSVNQLSVYGAVAAVCDEYESHQDSTGQPVILVGQSIVLGEIKAEVPAHDEELRDDQIILQQYVQQVESLSPENRLSKFCKEAGFMRVVEVGKYFVTRDAGEFQQTVACREYTLPRDDEASQPKGWIRGNMRIGPVLESHDQFSALQVRNWSSTSVYERRQFSLLGQNFLMEQSNMWMIKSKTTQKILQIHKKKKMYQQAQEWLQPGRKQKAKPQTERIYWRDNHPIKWKNMDWYWTIKARSRVVRSLEESYQSSSTQSEITSRRRWSNSILQNKIPSSRPFILKYRIGLMIDG